jgi:hypothetical protein
MAYEDGDDQSASSQTNYGLAYNPLMPMGDPLAYARMMRNPTGDATLGANMSVGAEAGSPAIQTQGLKPSPIMQPAPINVPQIPQKGGGWDPGNDLQPQQQAAQGPDQGQLGSLGQLLQLKGMEDLAGGGTPAAAPVTYTPGGAVATPGAGAGPGRSPTGATVATAAAPYKDMITDAAKQNGIDPDLYTRLLYQESGFNPKALSPAGAKGVAQFMPATAKDEGVDVNDPKSSIYGGARYLAKMIKQFGGNEQLGVAAYNTGPGNVQKWLNGQGKLLPETTNYVNVITGKPITRPTAAPGPTSQADQPFKPYQIAGAMQPPPTSSKTTPAVFGEHKAGQIGPYGGPYTTPDAQGNQYATDADGKIVGPPIKDMATPTPAKAAPEVETAKPSSTSPSSVPPVVEQFNKPPVSRGGQPGVSPAVQEADKGQPPVSWPPKSGVYAPPATTSPDAPAPAPAAGNASAATPGQSSFMNDPQMKKLWQYMLIKSLFPTMQFRNIGYDPWKVHQLGQSGGY